MRFFFPAPSLYGIFPYAGLKFYFYEEMKRHVPDEQKKNIMVNLVCGSVAGLLGQTFTYPLDVVRRQMQVFPWIQIHQLKSDQTRNFNVMNEVVRSKGSWRPTVLS